MEFLQNPFRGEGLKTSELNDVPWPSVDAERARALVERCPAHGATPLVQAPDLARDIGVGELWLKDERARMGLGSFKALGAAYVIADIASSNGREADPTCLSHMTFVTASAGNHGLSVAAGARMFGAKSVVYLATTVPDGFAQRLLAKGAQVVRTGDSYEASMAAATNAASRNDWTLLSDSSWPGYSEIPHRLMEGYLIMAAEIAAQIDLPPSHIFLQAGVGGMAGALAAYFRQVWQDAPLIVVVEPARAPALLSSIQAAGPVVAPGPVSNMGRLDCKEPSLIALKGLARDADLFMTIADEQALEILEPLKRAGFATTPSGGAGVAALRAGTGVSALALDSRARALVVISEEAGG